MSCDRAVVVVLLLGVLAASCVRSSGFPDPEPLQNIATIDGDEVALERISVETVGGGEYVDGKTARILAGFEELTLIATLGPLDNSITDIKAHHAPSLSATDGPNTDQIYEAIEGEIVVTEGDGAIGSQLAIQITNARLVHVCTGAEILVETATIKGEAVELVPSDVELGVGGFVHVPEIVHPTYGNFPYLGIASGRVFTNSSNLSFFLVETAEGCFLTRPRPNSHNFAIVLHPPDFEDSSIINLAAAAVDSFVFVNELSSTGARVAQALAIEGRVILNDTPTLDDGAEITGVLEDVTLQFVVNNDFTDDPPITIETFEFRSIMGLPILPD